MRVHQYNTDWPVGYCIYCNIRAMVDWHIMDDIPGVFAECYNGKKVRFIDEIRRFFSSRRGYDCRVKEMNGCKEDVKVEYLNYVTCNCSQEKP